MFGNTARSTASYLLDSRWAQFGLVTAALAFILVLSLQNYRAIDRDLTEAALSRRQALAYLTATTVSERFDRLTDLAVSLATRVRFRQLVSAGKWDDAIAILKDVPQSFPFIDRVLLNDRAGTYMSDWPVRPSARGTNFADRDWYQGVSRNWEPYVSNVYRRGAMPAINLIGVAAPVRDDRGEVRGVLLLQVKLDALFAWADDVDVGDAGFVDIIDRSGAIASDPDIPLAAEVKNLSAARSVQKALQGGRGIDVFLDPASGEERLVAYEPIEKYGWAIIMGQPTAIAFAGKNRLLRRAVATYGLILVLFAVMWFMGYRIAAQRRVNALTVQQNAELERRVSERTAQLEATNKELEGFSYSVSHDLRAPLRAIEGFSGILVEDYGERLGDEGRRQLHVVIQNCRRMTQLIDDLLGFSRLGRQPLTRTRIDMAALAQEALRELQTGSSADGVTIGALPAVAGDRTLLRQVWINLLANAIKFTARKGSPRIVVGGDIKNGESVYYVKDNGAGFDMAYHEKLFGVFQRLHSDEEYPGTGVGLAIVHRIITRHGGRVWAEGKVGEGATFYFAFPAEPA
jgi:signal transduction histidine kinase